MKKTFITLLALASMAMGNEYPSWNLKGYTGNDTQGDSITDKNHNFWVKTVDGAPITLTSYVFDFTVDDIAACTYQYTLFSTYRGDSDGKKRFGIGLGAGSNSADKITCYLYIGTEDDAKTGTTYTALGEASNNSITINEGDSIRFAYDAETATVLVYNATTDKFLTAATTHDNRYHFTSGTSNQGLGSSAIYTQGGTHDMTFGHIYDLSSIKGDVEAIKSYMKSIPEPTTATLSLLALCGLAARRRRK